MTIELRLRDPDKHPRPQDRDERKYRMPSGDRT